MPSLPPVKLYNGSDGNSAACAAVEDVHEEVAWMSDDPDAFANYEVTRQVTWRRGRRNYDVVYRVRTTERRKERATATSGRRSPRQG